MTSSADLVPGAVFARDFRIVKPLREGGMGAVYVVDQLSTGKQRALKVMIAELAQNPEIRERFVLEARAASKIESDHVVEIVTAGVDQDTQRLYLVMELLRGEDLGDAVARTGPLPIADVAEVLSQVGHALAQAHMQGLVHRDMKPENVFLAMSKRKNAAFTAKLLDFGIAKLVEDGRQKTGTQPLGSPLYMAPEQTDRKGRICPATDVWALALIAFYLLTAKSYWREAEDGSLAGLLREICIDPLALPSVRVAELGLPPLPQGFDAWFARCVNRDIDARFQEAGAAVDAFQALVPAGATERKLVAHAQLDMTGPVGASTTGGVVSSRGAFEPTASASQLAAGATSGSVPVVTAAPVPSGSSSRVLFGVLALVLGAAAAGGYFFATSARPKAPSTATSAAASAAPTPVSSASAVRVAPASGTCPEGMIYHPAGSMIMGAKDGSPDAQPTHKVMVGAFCLDKTEVTASAYEACVASSECEKPPQDVNAPGISEASRPKYRELCTARKKDMGNHPINCVDWNMATSYCTWKKGRLPTEAEWEFAARGSSQRDFPWGDDKPSEKLLNACGKECADWGQKNGIDFKMMFDGDDGYFATAPVGSFPAGASSLGVLDLAGNVWEWTADWYGPYAADTASDPKGPTQGTERVVRGGAFNGAMVDWAKPSYRWRSTPDAYNHAIGFRCVAAPAG